MIIGIDIGGTTTDVAVMKKGELITALSIEAGDPVTAAAGALGKAVSELNIPLSKISTIAATGVGSNALDTTLLGLPVERVSEFQAIGLGGAYLTGLKEAIVVSMGTGTALVLYRNGECTHYLGSGIGGGTILGLSKLTTGISSYKELAQYAEEGDTSRVDLTVGDIAGGSIGDLPASATAANFGKVTANAQKGDIARGLVNMVFQTGGLLAIASARANNLEDIILTGKLSLGPNAAPYFKEIQEIFGANFHIPKMAGSATAIGAAIAVQKNKES